MHAPSNKKSSIKHKLPFEGLDIVPFCLAQKKLVCAANLLVKFDTGSSSTTTSNKHTQTYTGQLLEVGKKVGSECFVKQVRNGSDEIIKIRNMLETRIVYPEYLVQYYGHAKYGTEEYLVMTKMPTDLANVIFGENMAIKQRFYECRPLLMKNAARSVSLIHADLIPHRDIKPPNFLVDLALCKVVLCDVETAKLNPALGMATFVENAYTPAYEAFEVHEQKKISSFKALSQADVFSLGVVLFEMFTGKKLFNGPSDPSIVSQSLPLITDTSMRILIKECLSTVPSNRPTAHQVYDALCLHCEFEEIKTNFNADKLLAFLKRNIPSHLAGRPSFIDNTIELKTKMESLHLLQQEEILNQLYESGCIKYCKKLSQLSNDICKLYNGLCEHVVGNHMYNHNHTSSTLQEEDCLHLYQ